MRNKSVGAKRISMRDGCVWALLVLAGPLA